MFYSNFTSKYFTDKQKIHINSLESMTNKELIRDLNSKNIALISKALDYISEKGNPEILPELITLLHENKVDSIQEQLIMIFENLHDQEALPYIIKALTDKTYSSIRGKLVATCWKNSLVFDDTIELFTDIFIESDFIEAFDALTVIDNMHLVLLENANKCLLKLETYLEDANEQKKPIFIELIKIIRQHTKNPAE